MQVLIFEITCEIIVFTYATCHNFYSLFAVIIPLKMELIPSHFWTVWLTFSFTKEITAWQNIGIHLLVQE